MLARIGKLFAAILLVGGTTYLLMRNWRVAEVDLGTGQIFSAPIGVVLLVSFILGLLTATLGASIIGVRAAIRERKLQGDLKRAVQHRTTILDAFAAEIRGDLDTAQSTLESVVKNTPQDQLARFLLADMLLRRGSTNAATQVLEDSATRSTRKNVEQVIVAHPAITLKAGEIYEKHGNLMAALGSIGLALRYGDYPPLLRRASDIATKLGKFDEALQFLQRLEARGEAVNASRSDIALARALAADSEMTKPARINQLRQLRVEAPQHIATLLSLGNLLSQGDDKEEAATVLVEAAKLSGTAASWLLVVRHWLNHKETRRALSVARTTSLSTSSKTADVPGRSFFNWGGGSAEGSVGLPTTERIAMSLVLISLYLGEGMNDEALSALKDLAANPEASKVTGIADKAGLSSLVYWLLLAVHNGLFDSAQEAYSALTAGIKGKFPNDISEEAHHHASVVIPVNADSI